MSGEGTVEMAQWSGESKLSGEGTVERRGHCGEGSVEMAQWSGEGSVERAVWRGSVERDLQNRLPPIVVSHYLKVVAIQLVSKYFKHICHQVVAVPAESTKLSALRGR